MAEDNNVVRFPGGKRPSDNSSGNGASFSVRLRAVEDKLDKVEDKLEKIGQEIHTAKTVVKIVGGVLAVIGGILAWAINKSVDVVVQVLMNQTS